MHQKLIDKLLQRQRVGTYRELSTYQTFKDFYSNDYLGFARNNTIQLKLKGATGSRLISGNSMEAIECENFLASHFHAESSLVFNSGYSANVGLLSTVPQRGDVILYDERIHASAKDGMRLSFADSYSFKHHDYEELKRLLSKFKDKVTYVVVEALYSMDGTMAHFRKLTQICNDFSAYLIVDEAHSAGIFGDKGRGVVSALGLEDAVFARIVTFGKSYGIVGAAVLGSENLKNFLVNFARPFIYTTALPDAIYQQIKENVSEEQLPSLQQALQKNIAFFRANFKHSGCVSEVNSPIQIIQIGNVERTKRLALILQKNQFAVKPILAPTVPEGQECLRICLHSFDEQDDIAKLISILTNELDK